MLSLLARRRESFIGAECVKLIAQYDKALEHVRETYPTVSASDDAKAQTAGEIWKQLWELLLEPVDPARAPGTAQLPPMHLREARAQQAKQVAEKFVHAFVNAAEFRVGEVFGYMKFQESHQHELPTPERPKRGPRGKKRAAPT
eukprot:jgi/Tetstr1/462939/TSEL_007887.t1